MLRLSGIGCLFILCVLVGNYYACSYEREYKKLTLVCDMLFDIKGYISYESMTFGEMIKCLRNNAHYSDMVFLSYESGISEIKNTVITNMENSPVFRDKEYNERLLRSFRLLGTSDKQTQLDLISGCLYYYEGQAEIMRGQLSAKKRLYKCLGLAGGALVSVILL